MENPRRPSFETASEAFLERFLSGTSTSVIATRQMVQRLNAARNSSLVDVVLITGESGVGKNHLARVLAGHRRWLEVRFDRTNNLGLSVSLGSYTEYFQEIHLPALPDNLIESELFGYKAGAFTDAKKDHPGLLGGPGKARTDRDLKDVLLDEIGDASPGMQSKLLQVIEERQFRPLGGGPDEYYETSARIIAATNRDLASLVREGRFREDLFWRLRQFVIVVPPLREQPENIETIARQIEADLQARVPEDPSEKTPPLELSPEDMRWARSYEWPGNVRELKHSIVRWFFEEGKIALKAIVLQLRAEDQKDDSSRQASSLVAGLVRDRLNRSLRDGSEPPGSLKGLVKEFEKEIKAAAHDWYRAESRSDEDLRSLFPASAPQSVRNKLSEWRRR
jgi:transcriptional regulator with PAS, ATPase and Fis domain